MRTTLHILLIGLFFSITAYAQTPTTIVKGGGTDYIVTGTATLTATQSITLKPNTWIKSGSTFTARVIADSYLSITRSNENYVYSRSYQKAMSSASGITENKDVIENIAYFDGLGRPMQSVEIKASPDKKDIVTHIGYDDYGRQSKDWLPYKASGTLGTYRGTGAEAATDTYYVANYPGDITSGAANPYSEKELEASPLNRVLKQAAPGSAWALGSGHEIEFDYQTNTGTEVKRYEVSITESTVDNIRVYAPNLVLNGSYGAGELYKTVTKDENHSGTTKAHTTEEFKDKQGRVVLKRTYGTSEVNGVSQTNVSHDTYYVYDDYGNLSYVLPPKSEAHTAKPDATELSELCYQYRYDGRNRLVEKKIPGKDWEYIVYNLLDQPVMTQDPNLKSQNKWLFTKYDVFGRVAYTGITNNSAGRTSLQNAANNTQTYDQYVTRTSTANTYAGSTVYYDNAAIPQGMSEILTISYYDSYVDTGGMSVPGTVKTQATSTGIALKGLATVSKVRVLTTNHFITTITGYDKKGRVIYSESDNPYLDTEDKTESKLDFAGKVEEITATHTKGTTPAIVTTDKFYYDHMGRLTKQTQTLGSKTEVIAQNSYDDLGQLQQKKVGNTTSKPLQTVDYTYNVRGWLKQINNPNSLGSDLFGFKINYNTTEMGVSGVTPLFNGNISETVWRTANPETNGTRIRGYAYTYDALNRIASGQFRRGNSAGSSFNEETNSYNVTGITYDKNGNIKTLNRRGVVNTSNGIGDMDNLVYSYDSGNKLTKVLDNGNNTYGFKDGANTTTEYTYDANGNMTMDLNKGIQSGGITYNHLNLPTSVTITGGNISYIYDAVGTKLKKVAGGTTTEYAGNYIYENGSLKFFSHAEGYVDTESGSEYVYQYKDHLGNVRLSYKNVGTTSAPNLQIQEENNYYPFGLEHKGYNNVVNGTENNYQTYLGKEISKELGLNWLSFRHRNYMPEIGRFFGVDPVAGDYVTISPYQFAHNNPVWKIELEGLEGQELNGFDVVNAPPSGQSGQNPAAHLPLPIGDRSSGSSSGNKTTRQLVAIQKNQMVTGYPGQALDEAVTAGIQWLGSKLSGSNVSKSTSENIQLGTNLLILITSKGKNLKAGGEALEQLTKTASTKSLAKISLNTSKLSGTGGDVLDAVIKKTNNIGTHLSPSDLKGAVKDILGSPVTINGKTFDHLGEVTDALKGLGKQISKLNKSIDAGTFSDEVLDAAKSLRTQLQGQKDQIQNVLNNAREAGGF